VKNLVALATLAAISIVPCLQDRWTPDKEWLSSGRLHERPVEGFVKKKSTAIAIARAVMLESYGPASMKEFEPLDAKQFNDVWVVYSNFTEGKGDNVSLGGPTTVEISKTSGAILNMTSGR
jgi:hypothetical protein